VLIYHPDLTMIGRRSITVGTASTENPRQYDHLTRIAAPGTCRHTGLAGRRRGG